MPAQKTPCYSEDISYPGPSIPNCLYQFSLHSAYVAGATADGPPVSFLTSYGDYAFCLFPDGTPILLKDSKAFHFSKENKVTAPPADAPLAFAMITLFTPENRCYSPTGGDTMANLRTTFATKGKFTNDPRNNPVPFCVRGAFSRVKTTGAAFANVQGMIFGFALPKWMESVSGPGIRCLFLSGCGRFGGEVVDFESVVGTFVEWATSENWHVGLPRDEKFETVEL